MSLMLTATEHRDLMTNDGDPWPCLQGITPLHKPIRAIHAGHAKSLFMERALQVLQASAS